jgi:hypothetical protein
MQSTELCECLVAHQSVTAEFPNSGSWAGFTNFCVFFRLPLRRTVGATDLRIAAPVLAGRESCTAWLSDFFVDSDFISILLISGAAEIAG